MICDPLWFSPTTSRQSKSLKLQHHLGFSAGYPQCFHTIFSMWKTAKKPSISIDHFPKGFPKGFQHLYTLQGGAPRSIAKLVNITPIIMVYRWYSYIYSWAYNQFITGGAPPCRVAMGKIDVLSGDIGWPLRRAHGARSEGLEDELRKSQGQATRLASEKLLLKEQVHQGMGAGLEMWHWETWNRWGSFKASENPRNLDFEVFGSSALCHVTLIQNK